MRAVWMEPPTCASLGPVGTACGVTSRLHALDMFAQGIFILMSWPSALSDGM